MNSHFSRAKTKLHAIRRMRAPQIYGHIRRRIRNRLVPKFAASYRASLEQASIALPAFQPAPQAREMGAMVAKFFAAEYHDTVPSCFSGRFHIMNKTVDFGSVDRIDWQIAADEGDRQIWRANLAQMGYLTTALNHDEERALAFAAQLIRSFLKYGRFEHSSDFVVIWHPYIASRRVQSLVSLMLLLPERFRGSSEWKEIEAFTRFNVIYVLRNLEVDLGFNHLERNLAALAIFSLCCGSVPPEIAAALHRHFESIVRDTVGDDGVPKERSATYHVLTVQSFRIFRALPIWSDAQRHLLETRLAQLELSLAALTLGDGHPVLFNDSWLGETPPISEIVDNSRLGFHAMPDGGYVRLAQGDWVIVMDAGPIGPDENPGHGHADYLSIEVSIGERRLIVDPGTLIYAKSEVRDHLRSWEAHNGPSFVGAQPVTFVDAFQVGNRAAAVLRRAGVNNHGLQTAEGMLEFNGLKVERSLTFDGQCLDIVDRWSGDGVRQSRFLIPAGWSLEREANKIFLRADNHCVSFTWDQDVEVKVGSGLWSRYYRIQEQAHEIVILPRSSTAKIRLRCEDVSVQEA